MERVFTNFDEIREDVAKNTHPVVYKYRTWSDDKHKSLLRDRQVWFAHPFTLNDEFDVRVPLSFDLDEIKDLRYLERMIEGANGMYPNLSLAERKAKAIEEWNALKDDPKILVARHEAHNRNPTVFEPIGVFSTSIDGLVEHVWDSEYGDYGKGYCVGFKTIEFCEEMKCGFGYVKYSDKPLPYRFLVDEGTRQKMFQERFYYKKESWRKEAEFRFLTVGIGMIKYDGKVLERARTFKAECVAEVLIGYDISENDKNEILEITSRDYPKGLPVYATIETSTGLEKKLIS